MKLANLFAKKRIILDLKAKNKTEAIKELGCFLSDAREVSDPDLFLKDVFSREALNTTGIGNHIAIPHARTDSVTDFFIVFGRSQAGVAFDSIDHKPVKLVFLIGTPHCKGLKNYLQILAKLARFLKEEKAVNMLYAAKTSEDIITAFKNFEEENSTLFADVNLDKNS